VDVFHIQLATWTFLEWLVYLGFALYVAWTCFIVATIIDRRKVMPVAEQWTAVVAEWKAWRVANPKKACTVVAVAAGILGGWIGFIIG